MKKTLIFLSAVLFAALMAIPALAEFPLEDLTLPEAGLHFGFNGDAKDDSGTVVGELVGDPTFVEGRDGTANGAVYLDDNEQYILLGKYVDAENYTASFWAKVEDNTEHVFLCSSILGSIRIIHDGGVYVGSTINGVVDNVSGYAAPRDEWVNLTFVYNGEAETMDIYANGEFQDTMTGALPLPLTLIGNEATEQKGWQSYPFLTLDDAYFFPRAFTEDEVKALYNGEIGAAASSAAAGESAFEEIWVTAEQEFYDDPETLELGGHGQPIQYVDGYGVGYSSLNDQVIFRDIDFGANGADKMLINFSNGGEKDTTLAIYIDEKSGDPDATFSIP
ncbi:MAG: LamG domain-containing protein, partial [Ruminococcaceae bacterium]|nr:LamG domain-containing protein [Oscillospiraceae bacterium]